MSRVQILPAPPFRGFIFDTFIRLFYLFLLIKLVSEGRVGARGPRNSRAVSRDWRVPSGARWYPLYEGDENFRLWFDNLARGSPTTAIEAARVLYRFLGLMGWSLEELTGRIKGDRDRFEKTLISFVGRLEREGYAPAYIVNYLTSVRSWANWHGVELVRKIKISNRDSTPTLDDEKVPTPQQVQYIRSAASPRGRICVGGLAYAGLRPQVLGHQKLVDGLKLGDLPELDVEALKFTVEPALVVVRQELSKAGHKYRTFFPEETCRDILAYLDRRGDEELTEESPLIAVTADYGKRGTREHRESEHIVAAVVGRDIRSAMRPTYDLRPYVLRSFFSTRLLLAVSDGVLDNNYRVYWMGHQGTISARYSSNKAALPDDLIENMREAYKRCHPYLLGSPVSEQEMRKKQLLDTARLLGFEEEKLLKLKEILARKSVDEAVEEFRRLSEEPAKEHRVANGEPEMLRMLEEGWELVQELNGGRFLMSKRAQ